MKKIPPCRVAFIILQYKNFQDTLSCVQSLLDNLDIKDFVIHVVDNGSSAKVREETLRRLPTDPRLHFIENAQNLGFAQGLNKGIAQAEKYSPQYYFLLNSDTLLLSKNLSVQLEEAREKYAFDILGPRIISAQSQEDQNPLTLCPVDRRGLGHYTLMLRLYWILNRMGLDVFFARIKNKLRGRRKRPPEIRPRLDVPVHGAVLVFSGKFIQRYGGLHPGTFLYMEENILRYQALRDGLVTLYHPQIIFEHAENATLTELFSKERERRRFFYQQSFRSIRHFKQIINKKINLYD